MSDRSLRLVAAGLALGGVGVMAYLLYVRHAGTAPICAGSGCATVQRSGYAEMFGVPMALVGLLGYVTIAATSCVDGSRARAAQAVVALAACAFSLYLLVVQLSVIGAVCEWCLAGDALTTGLAAVALVRLSRP